MANNGTLIQQSIQFMIDLVVYYKWLVFEKRDYVFSRQIMKSGSSIGANIHEAIYGSSKADFAAKLQISLKEASETLYWLSILKQIGDLLEEQEFLIKHCESLKKLLIASIKTVRKVSATPEPAT